MTLTYDSEIYHVLNGTKNWSLQIIVTDMETGKELENIKFPEEDYNLSIRRNLEQPVDTEGSTER